jgi:quercetin dioxygenase-like cupin family protein
MFSRADDQTFHQLLPGVEMKPLSHGEKTLMVQFRFKAGADLPIHQHPYEQTGYLVSGRMRLTIGSDVFEVLPGDNWAIPEGVDHGAEILEPSVALELFSPVREDYLPHNL